MGDLIRSADWTTTPLGPRECWPQCLRTVLNLVLESPFPNALLWGRELCLLYNDAFRELAADQHPRGLGRSAREVWPEEWSGLEAIVSAVMERGESICLEDKLYPVERHGKREDACFSLGCSPVRADDGKIVGSLVTLHETTRRVREFDAARLREALQEGQESLRLALSAGAMATWDWDISTGEVVWNDEHYRMLGYEPGELKPSYAAWAERVHPADLAATEALVLASVEKGGEYRADFRALRPDGSVRWIEARGYTALTPEGKPCRQYGVMVDITERKHNEQALRESERLYRAIGESIDYGVWVCAPDGRNIYASPSFLELVGLTQEQCSSFGWGSVLHPDDEERTIAAWKECVRTGGVWDIEHRYRGVDGEWHPILARGVAVRNEAGEVTCWAGINLDISRIKQTEAALREADRRKDEFLAVLSHELRNPLTPIRNSLYVLEHTTPGGEQAERAQAVIGRQVTHLARLVDDLLDVTRIARGNIQLQRERLNLPSLIRRTVDDHRAALALSELELELILPNEPVQIHADPTRIAQVLGNLLENARKFTPRGGRVVVSLSLDGGEAVVSVRDTGEGIAPDLLPRLFEPFTQGEQTIDRSRGGLGLGLALSKGLVDQHGGTITAVSEGLGRGAEFTVRLPIDDEAERTGFVSSQEPVARGRRVLVIEDNPDAGDSLRDALELGGHDVVLANDGSEGIRMAHDFVPDVVLCDIGLPGMDGYAVARSLRADPKLATCLLVALTGYALPEDIAKATAAGFDRHLPKPPSMEKLEQLLAEEARR